MNNLTFEETRQRGKDFYQKNDYSKAILNYKNYLKSNPQEKSELTILYSNIALCYYKLCLYEKVIKYSNKSLEIDPSNIKSLHRRSLAYEHFGKYILAYQDAQKLLNINPKFSTCIERIQKLVEKVKLEEARNSDPSHAFEKLLEEWINGKKNEISELLALGRDEKYKIKIYTRKNLETIVKTTTQKDLCEIAFKLLCFYVKENYQNTIISLEIIPQEFFAETEGKINQYFYEFCVNCFESIVLNYMVKHVRPQSSDSFAVKNKYKTEFFNFINNDKHLISLADIVSNVISKSDPNFKTRIFIVNNLNKILKIHECICVYFMKKEFLASLLSLVVPQDSVNQDGWTDFKKFESLLDLISLSLDFIFTAVKDDEKFRKVFFEGLDLSLVNLISTEIDPFAFTNMLLVIYPTIHSDSEILSYILIDSPKAYGQLIMNMFMNSALLSQVINMLKTYPENYIYFICKTLISILSCKNLKLKKNFIEVIKAIFELALNNSRHDVQVLGLLGFSKFLTGLNCTGESLSSYFFAAKAIFVQNGQDDSGLICFEVLSFLTLDGDVKELFINDKELMEAFFEKIHFMCMLVMAARNDRNSSCNYRYLPFIFCSLSIFANLASIKHPNAIKQNEELNESKKELKKLAASCGGPVPKKHPKDTKAFVQERVKRLSQKNFFSALSEITRCLKITPDKLNVKSHMLSNHSPYYISMLFYTTLKNYETRSLAAQSGAVKALLSLCSSLKVGVRKPTFGPAYLESPFIAAHALALIAIAINPSLCFNNHTIIEAINPLLCICDFDHTNQIRFDGFLALTNLVSSDERVRSYLSSLPNGFGVIENGIFDDNILIRTSSVELTTNLLMSSNFVEKYFLPNEFIGQKNLPLDQRERKAERIRLFVLLAGEIEESQLSRAAAGGLAFMSHVPILCQYMLDVDPFFEIMEALLTSSDVNIVYRALYILRNIISHGEEFLHQVKMKCERRVKELQLEKFDECDILKKVRVLNDEIIKLI